jgi:hypothetical protein
MSRATNRKVVVMAYYKGSPISFSMKDAANPLSFRCNDQRYVDAFPSMEEGKRVLLDQLDVMERRIVAAAGGVGGLFNPNIVFNKTERSLWLTNISCLIHMGVLEDNNMNGFLVLDTDTLNLMGLLADDSILVTDFI